MINQIILETRNQKWPKESLVYFNTLVFASAPRTQLSAELLARNRIVITMQPRYLHVSCLLPYFLENTLLSLLFDFSFKNIYIQWCVSLTWLRTMVRMILVFLFNLFYLYGLRIWSQGLSLAIPTVIFEHYTKANLVTDFMQQSIIAPL